jgi:hypothetical protein
MKLTKTELKEMIKTEMRSLTIEAVEGCPDRDGIPVYLQKNNKVIKTLCAKKENLQQVIKKAMDMGRDLENGKDEFTIRFAVPGGKGSTMTRGID